MCNLYSMTKAPEALQRLFRMASNRVVPNVLVETVNHERMPVLLATPEMQDQWMDGTDEEAFALCKPYPPEKMQLVQSGFEKRDLLG